MTYEEFKKKIELATGVSLIWKDITNYKVLCEKGENCELLAVNKNKGYERHFKINTIYINALLNLYNDNNYKSFWIWLFELVETPTEERVQEQKYYIKLKLPDIISDADTLVDEHTFLNVVTNAKTGYVEYNLSDRFCVIDDNVVWKTHFTNQEFEEIMPKEYRDSFELIPVEEEEE